MGRNALSLLEFIVRDCSIPRSEDSLPKFAVSSCRSKRPGCGNLCQLAFDFQGGHSNSRHADSRNEVTPVQGGGQYPRAQKPSPRLILAKFALALVHILISDM